MAAITNFLKFLCTPGSPHRPFNALNSCDQKVNQLFKSSCAHDNTTSSPIRIFQCPNVIKASTASHPAFSCGNKKPSHCFIGGKHAFMQAVRQLYEDPDQPVTHVTNQNPRGFYCTPLQVHPFPQGFPLTSNPQDKEVEELQEMIADSSKFQLDLSNKIKNATGVSTFEQEGIILWSNKNTIEKQKAIYKANRIEIAPVSPEKIREVTLLQDDQMEAFSIVKGGRLYEDTYKRIRAWSETLFDYSFSTLMATVLEVHTNASNLPFQVKVLLPNGRTDILPVLSVFGSLGHNEVYRSDEKTGQPEKVCEGTTKFQLRSQWVGHHKKQELFERFGIHNRDETLLAEKIRNLSPVVNCDNMQVTVEDCKIKKDTDEVKICVQVHNGSYFEKEVDPQEQLHSMEEPLKSFCGSWEPYYIGTHRVPTGPKIAAYREGFLFNHAGNPAISAASLKLISSR